LTRTLDGRDLDEVAVVGAMRHPWGAAATRAASDLGDTAILPQQPEKIYERNIFPLPTTTKPSL
jgi:hypothetical protein